MTLKIKVIPSLIIFFCAAAVFVPDIALSNDIHIIANKVVPVDTLSAKEIKSIFLGSKTRWPDDTRIYFVIQKDSEAHNTFCKKYTRKNMSQYRGWWRKKLFIGKATMPKAFATEEEIIEYVSNTEGAISYISSKTTNKNVKVLTIK